MAQNGLASSLGKGILDFIYGASKPVRMVNQAAVDVPQIIQSLITGKAPGAAPNIGAFGLNPQETQKVEQNPAIEGLKSGADAASYAIPFGKAPQGANLLMKFLTKAALPGATVGALQGVSQDNATPESVIGNAALGAGGASALHGLLGIPAAVAGKTGNALTSLGGAVKGGVNKIEAPASIYGASQEKAIQNTLDKLKITGNAQEQYQKLEPAFQKLSDQIETSLFKDPKTLNIDQVKNDLMTNLSSNKTFDLNGKNAKGAVDRFVESLYTNGEGASIVPDKISTPDLFSLKQSINKDYGTIKSKLINGQPLSDQEKVVYAARKTLDDLIANAHPDVKEKTVMQSHLYDAADSLAQSRNRDLGVSILGTKIPSPVAAKGQDILGRILQGAGKPLQSGNQISSALGNPLLANILGQLGARGAVGAANSVNNPGDNPQNPNSQINNNTGFNEPNNQPHDQGIAQQDQNSNGMQITPKMVSMAYLTFPKIKADKIAEAYKAQFATGQAPDQINAANAKDGLRGLGEIQTILQQDPSVLAKKLIPGPIAGKYKAAETQLLTNFVYLKTGKQVNPSELKNLQQLLPQAGDSPETVQYKLGIFKNFYSQVQSGQ